MTAHGNEKTSIMTRSVADLLGEDLLGKLREIGAELRGPVYLSGGTVRDLLLAKIPRDIDLTVASHAKGWAAKLVELEGATYVTLGREEDAVRVVWKGRDYDFTSFREGAESIEEELTKRDITVNSMAVCLDDLLNKESAADVELQVIDPVGGVADLEQKVIRLTSAQSITNDPLRMLRVFRFAATLDCKIDPDTFSRVIRQKDLITKPAAERVAYELDLIMRSNRAHATLCDLARSGLLFELVHELEAGKGMEQPASHHLDVFNHSLAAVKCMEKVQESPREYFPEYSGVMSEYMADERKNVQLRWAALLHDLGKPSTVTIDEDRGGRITFYNHDLAGAKLVETIGRRLKWSVADISAVSNLVGWHMRPFHLCNVQRKEDLSLKACLRLVKKAGQELPGLFMLSMADALAGKGEERPEQVENEVAALFARMVEVQRDHVEPVRSGPPLLTGQDLIDELELEPGPIFRKILDCVEEAHMERKVMTREEALEFVRNSLESLSG